MNEQEMIQRVRLLIGPIIARASELTPEDNKRMGGCLAAIHVELGRPVFGFTLRVGEFPSEKNQRYWDFGNEKALRLCFEHPEHMLSSESRDPNNGKWGGAARAGDWIFSFSGLTPDGLDEAVVLALAVKLELLRPEEAMVMASTSTLGCHGYLSELLAVPVQ